MRRWARAPCDCCALDCTLDPPGSACADDGNACATDACDGAGAWVDGGAPECGPCGVCNPVSGCQAYVRGACMAETRARLDLRKGSDTVRDRAVSSWRDTRPGDPAPFCDPTVYTGYGLCVAGRRAGGPLVAGFAVATPRHARSAGRQA